MITLLVIIPFIFTLLTSGSAEILGYRFERVNPDQGIKTYYTENVDIVRPASPSLYGDSIVMQGLEDYEAYTAADGSTDISGNLINIGTYPVQTYYWDDTIHLYPKSYLDTNADSLEQFRTSEDPIVLEFNDPNATDLVGEATCTVTLTINPTYVIPPHG